MKKYLYAGLLAACLATPAFAANHKLTASSPDEPLHRRTIVLCMALFVGLHAYQRRQARDRQQMLAYLL
jgi:hypothetical protein